MPCAAGPITAGATGTPCDGSGPGVEMVLGVMPGVVVATGVIAACGICWGADCAAPAEGTAAEAGAGGVGGMRLAFILCCSWCGMRLNCTLLEFCIWFGSCCCCCCCCGIGCCCDCKCGGWLGPGTELEPELELRFRLTAWGVFWVWLGSDTCGFELAFVLAAELFGVAFMVWDCCCCCSCCCCC